MLAELAATAETDAAFARRTGTALHRIYYWRRRLAAPPTTAGSPPSTDRERFVPVRIVGGTAPRTENAAVSGACVEAHLVSGVRLVFRGDWNAETLRPWLAALEAGHAR